MKYVNDNPANGIAFTRPMCPYPQQARYQGFGSTTDAANFVCVRRSRQQWPIIADFNTRDTDLGYFGLSFPDRPGLPWAVCRHQEHAGGQPRAARSVRTSAADIPLVIATQPR